MRHLGQWIGGEITRVSSAVDLVHFAPYLTSNVGPRAELSFSKSVFFNAFLQYNNQANNFNINARFQWRFKPVSDFFLVYTDNYFASGDPLTTVNGKPVTAFMPKNRAIVAKLTYWFNL